MAAWVVDVLVSLLKGRVQIWSCKPDRKGLKAVKYQFNWRTTILMSASVIKKQKRKKLRVWLFAL